MTPGSDNGLSSAQPQAIVWTNADLLSIGFIGTNLSEVLSLLDIQIAQVLLIVPHQKQKSFYPTSPKSLLNLITHFYPTVINHNCWITLIGYARHLGIINYGHDGINLVLQHCGFQHHKLYYVSGMLFSIKVHDNRLNTLPEALGSLRELNKLKLRWVILKCLECWGLYTMWCFKLRQRCLKQRLYAW